MKRRHSALATPAPSTPTPAWLHALRAVSVAGALTVIGLLVANESASALPEAQDMGAEMAEHELVPQQSMHVAVPYMAQLSPEQELVHALKQAEYEAELEAKAREATRRMMRNKKKRMLDFGDMEAY